ncbi:MAG: hypothetical protein AB1782_07220 [Cyanobacteriota bacterium]
MSSTGSIINSLRSSIAPRTEKLFTKLGSSPDPLITIIALCAFNMTVRPLITLTDKNQPKDRRIYAALREAVTEIIALPMCVLMARVIGGRLAQQFTKAPNTIGAVKNVFSLAGLVVANFIIPIIATVALDPIMKDVKKRIVKNNELFEKSINKSTNLNIISKSQMVNPIPAKQLSVRHPHSSTNIWNYYNLNTSGKLKIGN